MADIFREVDEEVRKDKFQLLWKKYGAYVYVVIGGLILGTAFNAYWRYYKQEQRLEDAARYGAAVSLLKRQQTTEAINGFAGLADESGTGYAVVGRFREAAARADAGDLTGAIRAYDRLAEDDGVDTVYRELARLLAAMRLVDEGSAEEVRSRLAPLLSEENPWHYSAQEIDAILALREGRREDAQKTLQALSEDAGTPSGVRARAAELLAALKSEE